MDVYMLLRGVSIVTEQQRVSHHRFEAVCVTGHKYIMLAPSGSPES